MSEKVLNVQRREGDADLMIQQVELNANSLCVMLRCIRSTSLVDQAGLLLIALKLLVNSRSWFFKVR